MDCVRDESDLTTILTRTICCSYQNVVERLLSTLNRNGDAMLASQHDRRRTTD